MKKIMVIGAGYMGKKYIDAILKSDNCKIEGIVCKSEKTVSEIKEKYGIECIIGIDSALEKFKPDIACICTPTSTHHEIALKLADKKINLIIEKPLSKNIDEAKEIKKCAEENNINVVCGHTLVFNESFTRFKKIIDEKKKSSEIKRITLRKYGRDKSMKDSEEEFSSSESKMWDTMIHNAYLLNSIIEEPISEFKVRKRILSENEEEVTAEGKSGNIPISIESEYNPGIIVERRISVLFEDSEVVLKSGKKDQIFIYGKELEESFELGMQNAICNLINYACKINEIKEKEVKNKIASLQEDIESIKLCDMITKNEVFPKKESSFSNHTLRLNLGCNISCIYCNVYGEKDFKKQNIEDIRKKSKLISEEEVIITGGEPSCLKELGECIQILHDNGKSTCLQTNGILFADKEYACKMRMCGLDRAFVSLPSHKEEKYDYITNSNNFFKKSLEGIKNLDSAGIKVNLCHVLTTINYEDFPDFVKFIKNEYPFVSSIDILMVQNRGKGKDKPWLVPRLSRMKPWLDKALSIEGSPNIVNAFTIPLCFFDGKNMDKELTKSNDEISSERQKNSLDNEKVKSEKCISCNKNNICSGVWKEYTDVHGIDELNPSMNIQNTDSKNKSLLLRPSLECNQNCLFCNVKEEKGFNKSSFEKVMRKIADARAERIVISGGEPTLFRWLPEAIKFASMLDAEEVGLQTNGMMFSYNDYCKSLKESGLTDALVSLHSHNKEISDKLTRSPGSWKKTVEGIKNLISSDIRTRISHVITSENYKTLPDFMKFVKSEFKGIKGIDILLDQHRGEGLKNPEILPSLSEIKPYIDEAIKLSKEQGIEIMNAFTIPLCFWQDKKSSQEYLLLSSENNNDQINSLKMNKTRPESCDSCINSEICLGVWKGYEDIHGFEELKPVKEAENE